MWREVPLTWGVMLRSASIVLAGLASLVSPARAPAQVGETPSGDRLGELVETIHRSRDEAVDGVQALGVEALQLLVASPDAALGIRVRLDLSWHASRSGDVERGLELARAAREIAEGEGLVREVASADYHLAVGHYYGSDPKLALAAAERALAAQRELREWKEMGSTLTMIGCAHRSRSDYDDAIEAHLEALRLSQRERDTAGIARSQNNIGLIYWKIEEHSRARDCFLDAAAAYRDLGAESRLASVLSNTGLVLIEMGDPAGALPILEEGLASLERAEPAGAERTRARIFSNLAFALVELDRSEEALGFYLESVKLRRRLGDDWGLSRSLGSLGRYFLHKGSPETALPYYEEAAEAARRADAREELSEILKGLAEAQSALGLHEQAVASLTEHLAVVQDLDRAETIKRITTIESRALLDGQRLLLEQARLSRNSMIVGAIAFFSLGLVGWNLFLLKRRAHKRLEALHCRLAEHASDLEEARGRIEGLEDLLPICSYCKSIRDEGGSWHRLEAYLHDRAGARMTHGICPDCFDQAVNA